MHGPFSHLASATAADHARINAEKLAAVRAHQERVFNALIPACAVSVKIEPNGVRYLHPRKGWKFIGKSHFAIRGVV